MISPGSPWSCRNTALQPYPGGSKGVGELFASPSVRKDSYRAASPPFEVLTGGGLGEGTFSQKRLPPVFQHLTEEVELTEGNLLGGFDGGVHAIDLDREGFGINFDFRQVAVAHHVVLVQAADVAHGFDAAAQAELFADVPFHSGLRNKRDAGAGLGKAMPPNIGR